DMERILKASLYTREIIKKLMIFSRQMPPQISEVNLNETVSNILYFMDAPYFSGDRKSTRLNSSHVKISYAVFCLKKKTKTTPATVRVISSLLTPPPPRSTLFPYTTLFRSRHGAHPEGIPVHA